jgi:hypothetical protein
MGKENQFMGVFSLLSRASVLGVAALIGLSLVAQPAAAQGTPEQRAACEGDAMRLCNQYVPDVQRITACMAQHRRYLSPRCRAVFSGGAKKVRRAN